MQPDRMLGLLDRLLEEKEALFAEVKRLEKERDQWKFEAIRDAEYLREFRAELTTGGAPQNAG